MISLRTSSHLLDFLLTTPHFMLLLKILLYQPKYLTPILQKYTRGQQNGSLQQPIAQVSSHKHLGLTLSEDLSLHEHFEYIKSRAWGRINIMRKLKFQLDRRSLQIIYFSFIRPLLQYADVV